MARFVRFGRRLPPLEGPAPRPAWLEADRDQIERALEHALAKPAGGWVALDASRSIGGRARRFTVAAQQIVVWRAAGRLFARDDRCPHMGASLCEGNVARDGRIVCPWHGLTLPGALATYDDGVLSWVQIETLADADDPLTERPNHPSRPAHRFDAVIRRELACAPRDVIQNRLDPWHGVHFHPHSFVALQVTEQTLDHLRMRVAYRVAGPLAMEVDARFDCPDKRTIAMTIVDGEGVGSLVETHATPIDANHTALVEATIATSERATFRRLTALKRFVRPFIARRAAKLWDEDARYAERLAHLRREGSK